MADNKAYRQWCDMATEARKIAADPSVPLWQKAHKVPGAYEGLELGELRSKHKHRILAILQQINKIIAPYNFTSFGEYQIMSEKELQSIIFLAKQLAPQK